MPGIATDLATQFVETVLYSISSVLYLPVLLTIVCLVLYLLMYPGAFAGERRARLRGIRHLVIEVEAKIAAKAACSTSYPALKARLERIVQKVESTGLRRLDGIRFAVRVGPALELIGTLIPMGISLAGLAQGNLPQMAQSTTTAFTAAVVGLACSALAYVLALAAQ